MIDPMSGKMIDASKIDLDIFTEAEREKVLELCGGIETDNVNHPSHYETGKYQCIDVMEETQGTEAVKDFCICNAFKYIYRHSHKNGLEDAKKAVWYLNKYIEYGSIGGSVSTNVSIPVYSETKSSDISHMAQILLGLHLQDGGTLPSGEDSSGNYQKVDYLRINWENKSESLKTPIDKGNLNKMDKAIDDLCKNLDVAHTESEVKKLDKSSANKLLSETPTWDAETGILTFKFFDGTSFNVDFNVEKIPVSFSMDSNGVITMTTDDGTEWTADVSKLIQDYNFNNGLRISFAKTKKEDGYDVSADLVKGSITEEYLEKNYLANIISNVNASNSNATNAATSATNAANDAKLAQSYAIGSSGIRDGEDTDNAKYYSQQASNAKQEILDSMNIAGRGLTVEYDADLQRNVFALARECVQITDWNTQFYTGFYGSSVSANGVPSDAANYGTAFFGIVLQATDSANRSSVVYQTGMVYKNSRTDFSGIKKYERVYAQGQWSSWVELQLTDTIYDDTEIKESISQQSTEINEIGEKVSDVRKEITVNLLNPTLETTTVNGITCTNNGDGTYTISGTATDQVIFDIANNVVVQKISVITGCKGGSPETYAYGVFDGDNYSEVYDGENKAIQSNIYGSVYIVVRRGVTVPDTTIIKPMLTTNFYATYDDFVPYTGDSGSLNGDVADLRANVDNLVELGEDITD